MNYYFYVGPVSKVFPLNNVTWRCRNDQRLTQSQSYIFLEKSKKHNSSRIKNKVLQSSGKEQSSTIYFHHLSHHCIICHFIQIDLQPIFLFFCFIPEQVQTPLPDLKEKSNFLEDITKKLHTIFLGLLKSSIFRGNSSY